MTMSARSSRAIAAAALAALLLPLFHPTGAFAVSCREELDRLERRLNESSLAAAAPDRYAEIARAVEEASELRDEALCMQRAAELNAALDDALGTPPASSSRPAPPKTPRPAAPLLLDAAPVDYAEDDADDPAPEKRPTG